MKTTARMTLALIAIGVSLVPGLAQTTAPATPSTPTERVYQDEKGRVRINPPAMAEEYKNPWTPELEEEFINRSQHVIKLFKGKGYGNTYFENEKQSYPTAMLDFLAGNRQKALAWLQMDDNEPWSSLTLKVDLFPSFTLKGQVRKYFFFGPYLDPAYKQKMFEAAKIWTEKDPLRRANPFFKQNGDGWTPENKNSWVDTRNTDNLRAMREVSAYLFAEEVGNEEVMKIYKERLQRYVWALYNIGMGEWDSNNYHGHTLSAYINLYDFAKDPEMRLLGKAAMDWLCTAGALKYWHGAFGGPSKRDYGGKNIWGCNAVQELGLFYGDAPFESPRPSADEVHLITSNYRPPQAVVALARKQFARPTEMLVTHPTYENWKPGGEDAPEFFETQYYGNSFQLGTLTNGSQGDVNGFNLMASNAERGVEHLVVNSGLATGTKGISTGGLGGDNVAQYRNLVIWLHGGGDAPVQFMLPMSITPETEGGVTFLKYEKTWVALWPINLEMQGEFKAGTADIQQYWPADHILSAKGTGGAVCGFAMEVGEAETHGDYASFKKSVLADAKLDLTGVAQGVVTYTGARGDSVKLQYSNGSNRPVMWRNGVAVDWASRYAEYQPATGEGPVSLGWKQGVLQVRAGGKLFTGSLKDGHYTFSEVAVKE